MHRLKTFLITLTLLVVPGFALIPQPVSAALFEGSAEQACEGVTAGSGRCAEASTDVDTALKTAINIFSLVVGVVAVIMLIIAALRFITSNGDSNTIASARSAIIYAIIGLVIVAVSQFIVRFVISQSVPPPVAPPTPPVREIE